MVISPSVVITDNEACAGFEKYRTVSITAHNCGLCKGTKTVTFDSRTIHKFGISLEIAMKLFSENYEKAMIADKEQLEWKQIVALSEELVGTNKRNSKPDGTGYTDTYLFNVKGSISDNDSAKDFDMRLENLTPKQVAKLGKVLKDL